MCTDMRFCFLLNLLVGDIMAKLVKNISFKNKKLWAMPIGGVSLSKNLKKFKLKKLERLKDELLLTNLMEIVIIICLEQQKFQV